MAGEHIPELGEKLKASFDDPAYDFLDVSTKSGIDQMSA
jgi:hypothetical protein